MLDFITVNTHSSIRIDEGKIIYIDPFKITEENHDPVLSSSLTVTSTTIPLRIFVKS